MRMDHRLKLVIAAVAFMAVLAGVMPASAADKAITLKYATMNAPTSWHHTEFYVKWAEKVEKQTEGRVKVKIFPAQTLGKAPSFFDLVKTGVADIALGVTAYNPGQFPLTEMMSLPLVPIPNASAAAAALWELHEKYPAMQKEYEGTKLLHFGNTSPAMVINNKRPVTSMADMKGLQIRVAGSQASDALSRLGAVPVAISISEMYVALEKGVVDGVTTVWEAFSQIPVNKLKYITDVPLYSNAFWIAANPRSWDKISKQDQEIIWRECAGMAGSLMEGNVFDAAEAPAREITKEWEYVSLSEEELARWQDTLQKRGLPAQEFYDDMLRILKKYSQIAKYPITR